MSTATPRPPANEQISPELLERARRIALAERRRRFRWQGEVSGPGSAEPLCGRTPSFVGADQRNRGETDA